MYLIQYRLYIDKNARFKNKAVEFEPRWFYGRLDLILVCTLPASYIFHTNQPQRLAFGLVEPCRVDPQHASSDLVTYKQTAPQTIIDLASIGCVVGRIQVGNNGRWGIIDRSEEIVEPCNEPDSEFMEELWENDD